MAMLTAVLQNVMLHSLVEDSNFKILLGLIFNIITRIELFQTEKFRSILMKFANVHPPPLQIAKLRNIFAIFVGIVICEVLEGTIQCSIQRWQKEPL
jgi:hypothetical protein